MLTFQQLITVRKIGSHKEQFSEEELNTIPQILWEAVIEPIHINLKDTEYLVEVKAPELVKPKGVEDIIINLPDLRQAIVEQMKISQEISLTDLLFLVQKVYRAQENSQQA